MILREHDRQYVETIQNSSEQFDLTSKDNSL